MTPEAIASFGRGFRLGVAAERERCRGLLAQADAIADELAALKIEVVRLEALAAARPTKRCTGRRTDREPKRAARSPLGASASTFPHLTPVANLGAVGNLPMLELMHRRILAAFLRLVLAADEGIRKGQQKGQHPRFHARDWHDRLAPSGRPRFPMDCTDLGPN